MTLDQIISISLCIGVALPLAIDYIESAMFSIFYPSE